MLRPCPGQPPAVKLALGSDKTSMPGQTMRLLSIFSSCIAILAVPIATLGAQTAFAAATAGATCTQNVTGARLCHYKIGRLAISIAAVGESDAGISVLHSDIGDDFYARFAVQHGCIIVAAGKAAPKQALAVGGDLAFISPRDGKVYKTWQECSRVKAPATSRTLLQSGALR